MGDDEAEMSVRRVAVVVVVVVASTRGCMVECRVIHELYL